MVLLAIIVSQACTRLLTIKFWAPSLPFSLADMMTFQFTLADTCFESWKTINDCKPNAAARTLSPFSIINVFEFESMRAKSTNIFRTLWACYILTYEAERSEQNTTMTQNCRTRSILVCNCFPPRLCCMKSTSQVCSLNQSTNQKAQLSYFDTVCDITYWYVVKVIKGAIHAIKTRWAH